MAALKASAGASAKAAGALLSIGEVAGVTGIPQHVLRYWEARLPQLNPVKRAGGRRFYRPEDVAMVRAVQQLIDRDGYTLDGAAKALRRGPGSAAAAAPAPAFTAIAPASADMISHLSALRDRLVSALN